MQMIDCTCKKCGASLELDIDDIKMFCPYCGDKLMFDISSEDLVEIIKEKEETKRKEMDILEQQRKDREASEKEALDKKNAFKDYLQLLSEIVIAFLILYIFIHFL